VITRSCRTRILTASIKGKRGRKRKRVSCPKIQYPRETCPDFIEKRRERNESRREKARPRDLRCYHGPAGLNLVDYFVWGCRRQMVGSRERERINFRESAPPGCVLPLAEEGNGNAEKRWEAIILCASASTILFSLSLSLSLPFFKREKIKNLNCWSRHCDRNQFQTASILTQLDKNSCNLKNQEMNEEIDYMLHTVWKSKVTNNV